MIDYATTFCLATPKDGSFQGITKPGTGIAATLALLRQNGIEVYAEAEISALNARVKALDKALTLKEQANHG